MRTTKFAGAVVAMLSLSACLGNVSPADLTVDGGFAGIGGRPVSQLVAGIWVDPNGCDHWIIDDGVEGYLSERLTPDGLPVCSGVAPPNTVVGPYQN